MRIPPGAKVMWNPIVKNSTGDLGVATTGSYFFAMGFDNVGREYDQDSFSKSHGLKEWVAYNNSGSLTSSFTSQFTVDEGSSYNAVQESVREFIGTTLPDIIKNGVDNINWANFLGGLRTRKCDDNTTLVQGLYDRLH